MLPAESLKMQCVAALLCGGKSLRMGFDKAFLQKEGQSLLHSRAKELAAVFSEVLLVCERREKLENGGFEAAGHIVQDRYENTGPLGAVCTAMMESQKDYVFAIACDMPHFDRSLLLQLWQNAAEADVSLCTHRGQCEPLFAFYHRRCLPLFQRQLKMGDYRLRSSFSQLQVAQLSVEEERAEYAFANLNTPSELAKWQKPFQKT